MTPSGIPEAGRLGHRCAIVDSEVERDAAAAAFVAEGITVGERVWGSSAAVDALVAGLARAGVDVAAAKASGQLAVVGASELFGRGRRVRPGAIADALGAALDRAIADGWTGVRLVGDLGWAGGSSADAAAVAACEAEVDGLVAARPATALCIYDRSRVDPPVLEQAVAVHRCVLVGSLLAITDLGLGHGLALEGEIDLSNHEVLRWALGRLVAGAGEGTVRLELGGLRFIDVPGTRFLVEAADALGGPGRVVLVEPPPILERILRLGWGPEAEALIRPGPGPVAGAAGDPRERQS